MNDVKKREARRQGASRPHGWRMPKIEDDLRRTVAYVNQGACPILPLPLND